MNASVHSLSSVKRHKGSIIEDFYYLHDFMDCSKEVESSNLHRVYFHNLAGIKNCIIPIIGNTIKANNGRKINAKDLE